MDRAAKILFFALVVKPVVLFALGLNVANRRGLPLSGPAVVAANHNSHLDTLVLMSLFPLTRIHRVRPVAAADYFLRNKVLSWFSRRCIGIIPVDRTGEASRDRLFDACKQALDEGNILILFPEGSRGEPEKMAPLKKGLYHLVAGRADTNIVPVVLRGLGKALPRGEALFVPFNCDVVIGDPLTIGKSADDLVALLTARFNELLEHCLTRSDTDADAV